MLEVGEEDQEGGEESCLAVPGQSPQPAKLGARSATAEPLEGEGLFARMLQLKPTPARRLFSTASWVKTASA